MLVIWISPRNDTIKSPNLLRAEKPDELIFIYKTGFPVYSFDYPYILIKTLTIKKNTH